MKLKEMSSDDRLVVCITITVIYWMAVMAAFAFGLISPQDYSILRWF